MPKLIRNFVKSWLYNNHAEYDMAEQGTDEYKEWYDGKLEEYNQTHNF